MHATATCQDRVTPRCSIPDQGRAGGRLPRHLTGAHGRELSPRRADTREQQATSCAGSQQRPRRRRSRPIQATRCGVKIRAQGDVIVDAAEFPTQARPRSRGTSAAGFDKAGTVGTEGNAYGLNDGAAAPRVTTERRPAKPPPEADGAQSLLGDRLRRFATGSGPISGQPAPQLAKRTAGAIGLDLVAANEAFRGPGLRREQGPGLGHGKVTSMAAPSHRQSHWRVRRLALITLC